MLVCFDGKKLRSVRKSKSLSQAALAVKMDSSIRHVRALETGEKPHPSAELLYKAALAIDVPMETFMQRLEEEDEEI